MSEIPDTVGNRLNTPATKATVMRLGAPLVLGESARVRNRTADGAWRTTEEIRLYLNPNIVACDGTSGAVLVQENGQTGRVRLDGDIDHIFADAGEAPVDLGMGRKAYAFNARLQPDGDNWRVIPGTVRPHTEMLGNKRLMKVALEDMYEVMYTQEEKAQKEAQRETMSRRLAMSANFV